MVCPSETVRFHCDKSKLKLDEITSSLKCEIPLLYLVSKYISLITVSGFRGNGGKDRRIWDVPTNRMLYCNSSFAQGKAIVQWRVPIGFLLYQRILISVSAFPSGVCVFLNLSICTVTVTAVWKYFSFLTYSKRLIHYLSKPFKGGPFAIRSVYLSNLVQFSY